MHTTGVLPGGGGGGGRGASSRVAAALDEDAQKRASREILERHAPQERCGGAALRLWFRLSGGAFVMHAFIVITHRFIHRDYFILYFIPSHYDGDHRLSSSLSLLPFFLFSPSKSLYNISMVLLAIAALPIWK